MSGSQFNCRGSELLVAYKKSIGGFVSPTDIYICWTIEVKYLRQTQENIFK